MYIDSHAHLFSAEYSDELHDVIERARDAGVERIVVPGTDEKTSREALELADRYDFIFACVGFHPHEAAHASDTLLSEIESMTAHPKVVGVGEIGLDYHYNFSPRDLQKNVFKLQIELAARKNLPIVVHTRDSLEDTLNIVDACVSNLPRWGDVDGLVGGRKPTGRGVFHCFTGTAIEARHLFNKGFFVSYPGIVTFKNSPAAETLKDIGCENILLETDSPYLSPAPMRGKRNEPAYVIHVGRKVSELLGLPEADVAATTSLNARTLFGLEANGGRAVSFDSHFKP